MTTLNAWSTYRKSEIEWLGEIPSHWEVRRGGALFAERKETGFPELPILEVSLVTGVTVRNLDDPNRKQMMSDRAGYKKAYEGDLPYNTMRMWQGAVGVAPVAGLVSPAYVVLRPRTGTQGDYYARLFKTDAFMVEVKRNSRGIVSDRDRLYWEDFKQLHLPVPPLEEQRAIAAFLDAMNTRITRFIAARKKMIRLLEEKKQAVINQAVTKGLDPTVPMKDSRVDWLGEIPAHWNVRKVKRLANGDPRSFTDGDWIESPYIQDEGIRLVQTGNVGRGTYREQGFRYISENSFRELNCTEVRVGDILVCRLGDPVGRACLAPELGVKMITSVDVCIIKTAGDVDPPFAVFAMSSDGYLGWIKAQVRGSTRDRVSRSMLGSFVLPLPPLAEQGQIASVLSEQTGGIENAKRRAEQQIELMQEYRTRLISDVVTGKLDVRDVDLGELPEFHEALDADGPFDLDDDGVVMDGDNPELD